VIGKQFLGLTTKMLELREEDETSDEEEMNEA